MQKNCNKNLLSFYKLCLPVSSVLLLVLLFQYKYVVYMYAVYTFAPLNLIVFDLFLSNDVPTSSVPMSAR